MPVIRTYACDDCGLTFEVTQNMADDAPDCPNCSRVLEWTPQSFAIIGTKAKAVDITQRILEQDYGLTNFNDNMRAGDVAAKSEAAPSTAQRDAEIRQLSEVAQQLATPLTAEQTNMARGFWNGGATIGPAMPAVAAADMLAGAKAATAAANAEGVNPMALLHQAGKQGRLKTPVRVVAWAKM